MEVSEPGCRLATGTPHTCSIRGWSGRPDSNRRPSAWELISLLSRAADSAQRPGAVQLSLRAPCVGNLDLLKDERLVGGDYFTFPAWRSSRAVV